MSVLNVEKRKLVVLKLGGSVLTDLAAYRRCAQWLGARTQNEPDAAFIAVVSAEFGLTDALADLARQLAPEPEPAALDLLWSTGELRSVALLAFCLHQAGIRAVGLNAHDCGLSSPGGRGGADEIRFNPLKLLQQTAHHRVAVVPGFLAAGPGGAVVTLGRGGSDLTAVVLAAGLKADRCELIKDVPGYFDRDPRENPAARPLAALDYETALRMARDGCDLVQERALQAAARTRTRLVVRGLDEAAPCSVVAADLVKN